MSSHIHQQQLCDSTTSQLLVIDVQERLSSAMPQTVLQQVLDNIALLAQAAMLLKTPIIHTEQYPKGQVIVAEKAVTQYVCCPAPSGIVLCV